MADGQPTYPNLPDTPKETCDPNTNGTATPATTGYCKRQVGLIGILLILSGIAQIGNVVVNQNYSAIGNVVGYVIMGLGFLWIEISDKGDYLLVTTGPCRWFLCGWGKEKVKYSEIRDYGITKSCWFGVPGVCGSGV